MKNNDTKEKKINWWRRFINYFLSLFRLRRKTGSIKEAMSVDLEEAASLLNTTSLSVISTTVAASVQASPRAESSPLSSPTLAYLQVSIEASTNSDAGDIASLGISEGEGNLVDIHDFDFEASSDIDLLRYLYSGSFSLPEEVQCILFDKLFLAEDPTFQTEDSKQAANEAQPIDLLERLRTIPLTVYAEISKELEANKVNEESTPSNSPRNR